MCRLERDKFKNETLYECNSHKLQPLEQVYTCLDCVGQAKFYYNGFFYCKECFVVSYFGLD